MLTDEATLITGLPIKGLWWCMLVADGGPAHHRQAADRHGQEAENLLSHHASVAMSWCGLLCTTAKPGHQKCSGCQYTSQL
ncbi:hypothetical protein WJX82_004505 [Trebouxia sp. C0006]